MKLAALIAVLAALVVSGIKPFERITWWLEVHALVLILGGAYSYARVPLGFWLQDLLHLERNPYDRIGHFMQGVVPAMIAREILLRGSPRSHRSPGFTTGSSSDLQSEDEPQLGR